MKNLANQFNLFFNYLFPLALESGDQLVKHASASKKKISVSSYSTVLVYLLYFFPCMSYAQSDPQVLGFDSRLCGYSCTSNDVSSSGAFIATSLDGTPIEGCTSGTTLDVYVCVQFVNGGSSDRQGLAYAYTLNVDGTTYDISMCDNGAVLDSANPVYNACSGPFSWSCGTSINVENIFVAWNDAGTGTLCTFGLSECPGNQGNEPNDFDPKCVNADGVNYEAFQADFTYSTACVGSDLIESVIFTDATSGGEAPFTYSWDFGSGAIPATANAVAVHNCSAPQYTKSSLHAGCVEIHVLKGARARYSSIENWSRNTFNLNTKRAVVAEDGIIEWVNGNLGSGVTMLYPASLLIGNNSKSNFIGIAFANKDQNQDTGCKVIHVGKNTSSTIVSKSIAKNGGITSYRGLVSIRKGAIGAKSSVECDALMIDNISQSNTYPYIDSKEQEVDVAHEATVGKISEEQIFYLMSRGLTEEQAVGMIVSGFIEPIVKELPLEYAVELNRLIELEMEGTLG